MSEETSHRFTKVRLKLRFFKMVLKKSKNKIFPRQPRNHVKHSGNGFS